MDWQIQGGASAAAAVPVDDEVDWQIPANDSAEPQAETQEMGIVVEVEVVLAPALVVDVAAAAH